MQARNENKQLRAENKQQKSDIKKVRRLVEELLQKVGAPAIVPQLGCSVLDFWMLISPATIIAALVDHCVLAFSYLCVQYISLCNKQLQQLARVEADKLDTEMVFKSKHDKYMNDKSIQDLNTMQLEKEVRYEMQKVLPISFLMLSVLCRSVGRTANPSRSS
jgi:hypothetical protein